MSKFYPGQILYLTESPGSAEVGALAVVQKEQPKREFLYVRWLRDGLSRGQADGGYYPENFRLATSSEIKRIETARKAWAAFEEDLRIPPPPPPPQFKEGDRVRVTRKVASNTEGWVNSWISPEMDSSIGKVFVVDRISPHNMGVSLKGLCYSYPPTGLELVSLMEGDYAYAKGNPGHSQHPYKVVTVDDEHAFVMRRLSPSDEPVHNVFKVKDLELRPQFLAEHPPQGY